MDNPPEAVQSMEVDQVADAAIVVSPAKMTPQEVVQVQEAPTIETTAANPVVEDDQARAEEPLAAPELTMEVEMEQTAVENPIQDPSPDAQPVMEQPTTAQVAIEEPTIAEAPTATEDFTTAPASTAIDEPTIGSDPTGIEETTTVQVPNVDSATEVAEMLETVSDVAVNAAAVSEPPPADQQGNSDSEQGVAETQGTPTDLSTVDSAQPLPQEALASGSQEETQQDLVVAAHNVEQPATHDTEDSTTSAASNSGDADAQSIPNLDSLQVLAALNNALAYRETHDAEDTILVPQKTQRGEERMSDSPDSADSYNEGSTLTSLGPRDGLLSAKSGGFNLNSASTNGAMSDSSKYVDNDSLEDHSIPESRFAGVFLDIVPDRRKLRGYIPSEEVKASRSLKVTIKKPDGWISRMPQAVDASQSQEASTSSGRRSGRTRKPKPHFDDIDFNHDIPTPSRTRGARQRVAESEELTLQEEPSARSRKVESEEFTLPADEVDTPDQGVSDNTDDDLVEKTRKSLKSENLQPTRKSGRVAEKGKRAHWAAVDDVQDVDDISVRGPSTTVSKRRSSILLPHNARAKHQRGPLPHDDGEIDELARSYSEDSMNDLSEEPATQSRKTGRGKGRGKGKGKGKRIIESDDDFELIEERAKSEDTAQSVDEDVLIYHRELCDKCFRPSAKDLMKAKRKKGRGRKRKAEEFEEGSADEAERLMGWIECEKCTVAFHWSCLPGNIRQKHLNEDKQLPPDEQIFYKGAPRGDDTLLLLCPHCETELVANCMACGTSEPLHKPDGVQAKRDRTADGKGQETSQDQKIQVDGTIDKRTETLVTDEIAGKSAAISANGGVNTSDAQADEPHHPGITEKTNQDMSQQILDKAESAGDKTGAKTDEILVPVDDVKPSDAMDVDELENMESDDEDEEELPLLFRCIWCKRCAHYEHLSKPPNGRPDMTVEEIAAWYQEGELNQVYKCMDCRTWDTAPEYILGWRPTNGQDAGARQDFEVDALEDAKKPQKREYLVKWKNKAFRHSTWVPHDYLSSVSRGLLLNFLRSGVRVTLETESKIATKDSVLGEDIAEAVLGVDEDGKRGVESPFQLGPPKADVEARERIPGAWTTPDRVLDVYFLKSAVQALKRQRIAEGLKNIADMSTIPVESQTLLKDGVRPLEEQLVSVDSAEKILRTRFKREDAKTMVKCLGWVYIKWQDLQYEAATWDTPLPAESPGYSAFVDAFEAYLWGRTVLVPMLKPLEAQKRDSRPLNGFVRMANQPSCVKGGQLMDFQLEGLNWLMSKWHNLQSCILADDMGLGKTVQIASFLALLGSAQYHVYPHLIVVPNSTLQNWTRELTKWAPHLRVVPYFGEKASKNIIKEYEIYHEPRNINTLKTHVFVTTYECITSSKDFGVFSRIPRWETLIVDEAQRLKAGSSLIFKKLNELNSVHKVLLTGTPLNNTIREILNLMNFLDPKEFNDLDALEQRYSIPDEELYKELRAKIAPYMLRRSKDQVLDLPAKNEIIVPLTMRPLQKQVYRGILERNADLMELLSRLNKNNTKKPKRSSLHNVLMQMRKCLQHPFLCNNALEDYTLSPVERHQALIDGSAKLGFLKAMLPKLRAKGHRVLLFSQFKIALDIIEQFFDGEDYQYLRLDGDTPQAKRQKDIDAFNAPNSPYFIFLLSTRAGGVGINLASADTVIIHDLDFNPHLDMQAIARSYRYGQQKTVMVYRLMMAQTVEANIMQASKKKLLLDHLIVQSLRKNVDDEDDFATIVLNGAKAVFDDKAENDISYSGEALDTMISELESREKPENEGKGAGFTFAPVYDSVHKSAAELPDLQGDAEPQDSDFWADVLKRIEDESKARDAELYGTGKRMRGKQISYANDRDLDRSQSRMEVDEPQEQSKPEDDVASQESDFELDNSDLSDAPPEGDLENELAELAPRPSKRVKRIPPRLALAKDDRHSGSDRGTPADHRSSMDEGSAGTAENPAKKPRGRPRKSNLATAAQDAQTAKTAELKTAGAEQTSAFALLQTKLRLAKTQIIRLRYAAADCNISDFALKVQAILSPQLDPHARWDVYAALATEVDDVLKSRSLQPVFMRTDVMHAVLPLFQLENDDASKQANGTSSVATSRHPATGKSKTHSSATSASSQVNARFAQSERNAKDQASIGSRNGPPSSRVTANGNVKKTKAPRPSISTQQATRPVIAASKSVAQVITPAPAAVCFFCSGNHSTTSCPGLGSHAKISEFSAKVQASEGSPADKAQWIKWLEDKRKTLPKPVLSGGLAPATSSALVQETATKRRSTSSEQKATDEQSAVEKLVGELIVIEDSD